MAVIGTSPRSASSSSCKAVVSCARRIGALEIPAFGPADIGWVCWSLTVACGSGAVRLTEVQRAGKQPVKAEAFLAGVRQMPATFA